MQWIERDAARALVLSPTGRVLLLRLEPGFRDPFWVTPGGGVDEGETHEQAVARELYEEVGCDDLPIGPCLWHRHVEFTWEDWRVSMRERVHLVEVPHEFEPVFVHLDGEPITGSRWFSAAEVAALTEVVYPSELAGLLTDLLRDGAPSTPIQLEDSFED